MSDGDDNQAFEIVKEIGVSLQKSDSDKVPSDSLGTGLFVSFVEVYRISSWSLSSQTISRALVGQ